MGLKAINEQIDEPIKGLRLIDDRSPIKKFLDTSANIGLQAVSSPFEAVGESVRVAREGYPFRLPSIAKTLGAKINNPYVTTENKPSDISEEIARGETGLGNLMTGQGLEKAKEAVETKPSPIQSMISGAMLPMPFGKAGNVSRLMKAEKTAVPEIAASKMIAGKLQHSSIENLANPYVNKVAHSPNLAAKTETLVQEASDSLKNAYDSIKNIQNKFYKNAGVTDDLPVNVGDALTSMKTKVAQYAESAIGTGDEKALAETARIIGDIESKAKNGTLTFGQIKKMKDTLYSIGEGHVNELGRHTPVGRLYKELGHDLTEAQKSLPQIKQAGDKYKDLLEAEDLINHATRLDRYSGEMNLAKKIKNRYTDIGNEDWKNVITKAEEIFKRHPESREFADFGDKIKAAHLALDVAKGQAILPVGASRFFGVQSLKNLTKIFNPQFQVNMIARKVKSGMIKPESLSATVKESQLPVGGVSITKMRALKEIFKQPYQSAKGVVKEGALRSGLGIRALLNSKRGEQ